LQCEHCARSNKLLLSVFSLHGLALSGITQARSPKRQTFGTCATGFKESDVPLVT